MSAGWPSNPTGLLKVRTMSIPGQQSADPSAQAPGVRSQRQCQTKGSTPATPPVNYILVTPREPDSPSALVRGAKIA